MNSLSWLLYVIDVISSLKGVSSVGIFIFSIGLFGILFFKFMNKIEEIFEEPFLKVPFIFCSIALTIMLILYTFVPSSKTMALIAASQVGEQIMITEQAKEIGGEAGELATNSIKLLNKYVADQLDNLEIEK